MRFDERRVLVDQGHKLISAINRTVAEEGNAIAGTWHSHWRQAGYDYREDHKERDDHVYAIRGNWAIKDGLMKVGPAGYSDEITQAAEEPFCFPGDSVIPYADGVEKAYRRWFTGELTEIVVSSGKTLSGTPNHPVLTVNGWVAIGNLKKGDYVIEIADDGVGGTVVNSKADDDHAIPTISEIFCSVRESGNVSKTPGAAHQFNGDGSDGDVDNVSSARP
jgi:hypothetical protein